jgi:hypothetical protein
MKYKLNTDNLPDNVSLTAEVGQEAGKALLLEEQFKEKLLTLKESYFSLTPAEIETIFEIAKKYC